MKNIVYHSLPFRHFVTALEANELKGHSTHRFHKNGTVPWPEYKEGKYHYSREYLESEWTFGICMTRSRQFAENWGGDIIMVFNTDMLRTKFKLKPYNWSEYRVKSEFEEFLITSQPGWKNKDVMYNPKRKTFGKYNKLLADRNYSQGAISNLSRYLVKVIVPKSYKLSTRVADYYQSSLDDYMSRVEDLCKLQGIELEVA